MRTFSKPTFGLTLSLLVLLLLAAPVRAQEDDTGGDDEGWGKILFEYGTWAAEAEGLAGGVVTIDRPLDPFDATILAPAHNSETEHWVRAGIELPRNLGRVTYTRYAHETDAAISLSEPGQFIYGELLAYPEFAGYANDGFADAVDALNHGSLRDVRIDFSRIAFSNSRIEGRWVAGIRRVSIGTRTDVAYRGLVPAFPPVGAPLTTLPAALEPIPDTVEMTSRFDGGGLSGGMEFRAPLGTPKLVFEGAFSMAILAGHTDASYTSENHFYSLAGNLIEFPYSEISLPDTAGAINQDTSGVGLRNDSQSTTSQVLEVSLGFRWEALDYMDVFVGYRTTNYTNALQELRPRNITTSGSAVNVVDTGSTTRSLTYEGFYLGVGFLF